MSEHFIPLALVAIVILLAPQSRLAGPRTNNVIVAGLLLLVGLLGARYLYWRATETLPAPGTGLGEAAFAWALFLLEMAVWVDTSILFATLSRRRDNSAAADEGEARLRGMAPADLPTVDVFIATYNEELEVLEKTIVGALALDWPADRLRVIVLDDGKRGWLKDFCAAKGADYFTRADNAHAKAGNINAAIQRTDGEYFMVLDADFVPQHNFLFRAMGLFEDPKVGIVQIPHSFYNADPMQTNLRMRHTLPDDQRLFFGQIMAGRDGWDAAFCCGSNSITRRTAIEAVGNGLPTGSITEDMLLTLVMLRKGYVTRYLNERLAIGLAPESLMAMYVQRARWARGAIQMLFLKEGPLGPGLSLQHRLLFLPMHWLLQPLMILSALSVPAICLWTGWSPMPNVPVRDLVSFQLPVILATLGALRLLAPDGFFPLASSVHAALQAPRILPTVITTLIQPHGHAFKVTPKGSAAGAARDRVMIFAPAALMLVTALGFVVNANLNTRVMASTDHLPLMAFWAAYSMVILLVVQVVAVSTGRPQREERFHLEMPCRVGNRPSNSVAARLDWLSLSAAGVALLELDRIGHNLRWVELNIPGVGPVAGRVVKQDDAELRLVFELTGEARRDELIRLLFTTGLENPMSKRWALNVSLGMLSRVFVRSKPQPEALDPSALRPPQWLLDATAEVPEAAGKAA
ncbi:glycosyltransferase family 2 protein [Pseudooceanicola nanhaiensis]|uniref:glycosyltransferase family 2 protein n=1 Tax=Pseudooceanicola nanhaiensis TaxID=375761 RepID=UPI001CD2821E|nr:glycosyltransferase family 2 protein [Pseudooceanicola nanhaiensis]MCA0921991.1 cellulose synthase catalytic subunit [Pseudooceanicola nanhaiensis]